MSDLSMSQVLPQMAYHFIHHHTVLSTLAIANNVTASLTAK